MRDKCFALNAKNGCVALTAKDCHGRCPFYKTRAQARQDQERAFARLRSLSLAQQTGIAETYYDGDMPWRKEFE